MRKYLFLLAFGLCAVSAFAQSYWNTGLKIAPLRLPLPPVGYEVEYLDLNNDGKLDAIKSVTRNNTPYDNDGS